MKIPGQITGKQAADFIEKDYDLQLTFPRRPCLIKELVLLPYGDRDIIVLGTDMPRLLKVSGGRQQVLKRLQLLDGTRNSAELEALLPAEQREDFFSMQALLFWYGLLQDGPNLPVAKEHEQLGAFLARYVGKTRFNRNRDEALERLKAGRLAVCVPASVSEALAKAMRSAGLGAHLLVANAQELAGFAPSFMLVVADGGECALKALQFAYDANVPCLLTMIGATETRIGPLLLPKLSVGHECVLRQLPVVEFMRDQDELLFWSAFALQETLLLMAGIATDSYFNKLILHHYGGGGRYSTYQALAPVPGSQTSGLVAARPLDVRSSAFLAWKHHCGTRFPPKKYLPPAAHQNHFTAQNIAGAQKPLATEYGSSIHPLPDQWEIPASLPWLNGVRREPVEFNAVLVGNLLRVSVGHQKIQNQDRRISPCGGGLKSAGLFVRTRAVTGIKDGWYAYDPTEHALETIQNLDEDGIAAALGAEDESPVMLVVVGRLQRTRDKYREFGYNIIHLDAGVATAFATVMADAYGWHVCHHPNAANASLAHSLRIDEKDHYRLVSNVFTLGKPPREFNGNMPGDEENWLKDLVLASRAVDPRPAMFGSAHCCLGGPGNGLTQRSVSRTFEDVLKSRRSSHSFKPFQQCPVKGAMVEDLVVIGHRARRRLAEEGMFPIPLSIYVLRALGDDELPSGAYETNPGSMATWKCLSSPLSPEDVNRCVNQNSLARAPLLFVMVADLDETFHRYGAAGYRHLLNQSGFVVGQIWLAASAAGLVGTACGIVIEEGMRNAIKSDGYTRASLFGFVLGEPEDKAKAG